jgi:antitoxin component YwqK of YwqJK toxin-antitoxin module
MAQDSIPQNGYTILKYPSGKKSGEGIMQNGKPEGIWKAYYENGALKSEGKKTAGITDSVWNFYSAEGLLKSSIEYATGQKNGTSKTFDKNGNLMAEEQFAIDKKDGLSKWFFTKSRIQKEIIFVEGKEQTVIFPKYPVFNSLTGSLRDSVMNEVERSSHRDKIVSLLQKIKNN